MTKSALAKSTSTQHRFCFSSLVSQTLGFAVEIPRFSIAEMCRSGPGVPDIVDFIIPQS